MRRFRKSKDISKKSPVFRVLVALLLLLIVSYIPSYWWPKNQAKILQYSAQEQVFFETLYRASATWNPKKERLELLVFVQSFEQPDTLIFDNPQTLTIRDHNNKLHEPDSIHIIEKTDTDLNLRFEFKKMPRPHPFTLTFHGIKDVSFTWKSPVAKSK